MKKGAALPLPPRCQNGNGCVVSLAHVNLKERLTCQACQTVIYMGFAIILGLWTLTGNLPYIDIFSLILVVIQLF